MIQKLRRQFVAVCMALVALVLVAAIGKALVRLYRPSSPA